MIIFYTDAIKKAFKVCCEAHLGQVDKGGLPYFLHPIHLAYQMTDEDTIVAALLHDVIEDTNYTIDDLYNIGFSDVVCDAVKLLTHNKNEAYMDYIYKIKSNHIARMVKLADLKHNIDLSRLEHATDIDVKRTNKYLKAISILEEE